LRISVRTFRTFPCTGSSRRSGRATCSSTCSSGSPSTSGQELSSEESIGGNRERRCERETQTSESRPQSHTEKMKTFKFLEHTLQAWRSQYFWQSRRVETETKFYTFETNIEYLLITNINKVSVPILIDWYQLPIPSYLIFSYYFNISKL
jgi:hypothetical protein